MKPTNRRLLLKVASAISSMAFLVVGGLCQQSAYADPRASDALSIQMSLLNGSNFSLGEPIVLQYKLTNVSDQEATAYVGPDAPGPAIISGEMWWLKIKITDADGDEVSALPNLDALPHNGQQFIGCRVQAGHSQQGYIVLSKSYVLPHPGSYSLAVLAQLPFDSGKAPTENAPGQEVPFEAPPAYLASRRFSFSLRVTPKDPRKLQALAGSLRKRVTAETDVAKTTMLIEYLFLCRKNRLGLSGRHSRRTPPCLGLIRSRSSSSYDASTPSKQPTFSLRHCGPRQSARALRRRQI